MLPPQPLVVEEQGAVPVEEVEVVHYHLAHKMLSEKKKFLKCCATVSWRLEKTGLEGILDRTLLDPLVVHPPRRHQNIEN